MLSLNCGQLRNQHKDAILHVLVAREANCASNLKSLNSKPTPKVNARPPAPSPHTGPKDYAFEMACSNIRSRPKKRILNYTHIQKVWARSDPRGGPGHGLIGGKERWRLHRLHLGQVGFDSNQSINQSSPSPPWSSMP